MNFLKCFIYLAGVSIIAFFVGRIIPKKWFRADMFPYRAYGFENNGRIYHKLNIRKWQNRVPDMSRIFPSLMPPKRIEADCYDKLPLMIRETCVAEFIHGINCIAGLYCLHLYPGAGGRIMVILYAMLFNLPYIFIQRHNRPRLLLLYERLEKRRTHKEK